MNNPSFNCGDPSNVCITELEHKGIGLPSGGNLRTVKPDKEYVFSASLVVEQVFPSVFLSKYLLRFYSNTIKTSKK